ncbi:exosortase A [Ideonella sp. A 288]|uniref:exosortase A n=1 Tax=Ideonella sp. A 288 TaxID=1962181 RepID=UPI000B4AF89F|nr:exosortase A [Ideonella sp. A 288]
MPVFGTMPQAWRVALPPFVLALVAILALYWDTGAGMVTIWARSETFTHAFLVPPIVLWLVWRQRAMLATLTPRPEPWALVPVAMACALWLMGKLVEVNAAMQFAMVSLLILCVPALLGLVVARALAFPLAFALFAVPIGEFMLPTLMQWTADFTVAALRLSGVPVYREGLKFVIPTGYWSVVEACSGVRYLIASFMVGSLFAYLNYRSNKRRWIFVGLSILVPILANWVRAYMIVMLGHLSNNEIATGVDHLIYGWVFFGVVIMALFMVGARWAEFDEPGETPAPARAAGAIGRPTLVWAVAAMVGMLTAAPLAASRAFDAPSVDRGAGALSLEGLTASDWTPAGALSSSWSPVFSGAAATEHRAYTSASGASVTVHLLHYRRQQASQKMVSSTNVVVRANDPDWNAVSTHDRVPMVKGVDSVRVTELLGPDRPGGASRDRLRVWQLYWINGVWTSSDVQAKLLAVKDRLRGRGDDAAVMFLSAREANPGDADPVLAAFLTSRLGAVEASLVAARDGAVPKP